jgi:PHP family Zn ribbon phosphoesterase
MNVLHSVSYSDLVRVVGEKIGKVIQEARQGKLVLAAGGGGTYGKVVRGGDAGDR